MRQYMAMIDKSAASEHQKNLTFELNSNHNLVKGVNLLRKKDLKNANILLRQLLDNALLTAGLLMDTKFFTNRVNVMMEQRVPIDQRLMGILRVMPTAC